MIKVPKLNENLIESIDSVVSWVESTIPRKRLPREDILKMGNLSISELKKFGKTHYMGACTDPVYLALFALNQNILNGDYNPHLVLELLLHKPKTAAANQDKYKLPQPHVALEFVHEDKLYSLDFASKNWVVLKEGPYTTNQPDEVTSLALFRTKDFNFDNSFLENILPKAKVWGIPFDATGYLEILANLNEEPQGTENFERFKKEVNNEIKYALDYSSLK